MLIRNFILRFCFIFLAMLGLPSLAEDIDLFAGTTSVNTALPNVIFVLDNTSNWSRQSQQWPGGLTQGQSEVRAIKNALADKTGKINVGIVEFTTSGNANQNGAFVRFDLQALTQGSQSVLDSKLDTIFANINSPTEKRNSNTEYGNLMYDVYNYLAGENQSFSGGGTPGSLADGSAYTSQYNTFRAPITVADACVDSYLIFIGNPNQSGPTSDGSTNSNVLAALYTAEGESAPDILAGSIGSGSPLPMPEFTTTVTTVSGTSLGDSASCWKSSEGAACTAAENASGGLCDGLSNCSCVAQSTNVSGCVTRGNPANRTTRWRIEEGGGTTTTVELTGQADTTGGAAYNLDDWSKFLRNYGVSVTGEVDGDTITERVSLVTYTIDVFNAQQNAETSSLLFSAADVGGGRYFQARSEAEIQTAINSALGDILADSSSFAAVTLPLSATNRAQVENEVYIGMFRPAPGKKARWFGNLKKYQLALFNGAPRLADVNLRAAIIQGKGFLRECSESFWSEDSFDYWENLGVQPPPRSECYDPDVLNSVWSDLPDGPFVEKGGVAQQIRNESSGFLRNLLTVDSGSIRDLASSDAAAMGGQSVFDYFTGDNAGVDEVMPGSGLRASIHGDVVHSRPLSIRYDADTVGIFYGSNDGLFRSVDPSDGSEKWSLVAPEHFSKLERLHDNSPLILYTGATLDPNEVHEKKDYFFDGSPGDITLYDANGDLELAYIYPTMRRGGRMVYALDVTDPDSDPDLLWRHGCPNLDNDTGCTAGFSDIGQTWSTPVGGYAGGYVDGNGEPKLIIAFGAGFDDCLNEDAAPYPTAACNSAKGKGFYILDAETGVRLKFFATEEPVIGQPAQVDIDFNGTVDFFYIADAAGNLYRVNLATLSNPIPASSVTDLAVNEWEIIKIGETFGDERRFYNAPVAATFGGKVFVAIGSGDRERPLDINYPYTADVQNRFYVLIDKPYETFVAGPNAVLDVGEYTTTNLDGNTMLQVVDGANATGINSYSGWYLDMSDRGEQVFNPAAIGGGLVFFNTLQPGSAEGSLCEKPKGLGKGYAVSLFAPEFTSGLPIPSDSPPIPPVIVTVKIPPGLPDCDGIDCPVIEPNPCDGGDCKVVTVCIGCEGFEPVEIIPDAPPLRTRTYFTEDLDRQLTN